MVRITVTLIVLFVAIHILAGDYTRGKSFNTKTGKVECPSCKQARLKK